MSIQLSRIEAWILYIYAHNVFMCIANAIRNSQPHMEWYIYLVIHLRQSII